MNYELLEHSFVSKEKKEGFKAVCNPATLEELAFVKSINEQELDSIILQAYKAQKKWASLLAIERANILMKWYELMLEYKEDLALILTKEMGKPIVEARGEIVYGANFLRWFAEECRRIDGDIIQPVAPNQKIFVLKQPIGLCAAITPWNFPCAMITRKVAPALACGCAMIVKPASATPLSAYAMLVLAYKAGVPNDVLQVVSGDTSMISQKFCQSDFIRKLTFTGSTEVGRLLMRQSANSIKKLSLELGGNAPFIVFNDANLEQAANGIMLSKFRNSGQTCVCANRIYIQSGVYDALCEILKEKLQGLKLGNGIDESTTQGPLIDKKAVQKVKEHISDALSKGAKLLCGGKESDLGFTFFEPTLLSGVNSQMLVAKEETFGPLAPLFRFEEENEVIEMANNTEFGLAAYLYTKDSARIFRVSEALEYGIVGVNTGIISTEVAPFGGVKQSGLGREGSKYGIDDYLELKYMCVNLH